MCISSPRTRLFIFLRVYSFSLFSEKWTSDRTTLLIKIRRENDSFFKMPHKKIKAWKRIYNEFRKLEPDLPFNEIDLSDKWRNLLQTYRKNKDKSKRSGAGAVNWEFFDPMDDFLGTKDSADPSPIQVVESSLFTKPVTSPLKRVRPQGSPMKRGMPVKKNWLHKYVMRKEEREEEAAMKAQEKELKDEERERRAEEREERALTLLEKFVTIFDRATTSRQEKNSSQEESPNLKE